MAQAKKDLVIVESPAKARTIEKYLGGDYKVIASMGHLRDLPKSKLGVDIEHGFTPEYIPVAARSDVINELKKRSKEAGTVYLATDPDREGEAISWHLKELLKIPDEKARRVTFNEITKKVVQESIANPRDIDQDLVDAQQARRILDRIVGYKLSPLLWRKVRRGLSAGRVQSVAIRMVVDRENEIRAFQPEEYWYLDAHLDRAGKKGGFVARYYGTADKKKELHSEKEVEDVIAAVEKAAWEIGSVKRGERQRSPSPPFITSTLQQEASRRLGLTPRRTMSIAQQLYEGVDITGEGTVGLITYMRTDSLRLSEEAMAAAGSFIRSFYGEEYYYGKPRRYKTKAGAQDAHEAIRPSNVNLTPERVKKDLTAEQYRLYRLIWGRFTASQMANAVYDNVVIDALSAGHCFKANHSSLRFPGYTAVYEDPNEDEETGGKKPLPDLAEGEIVTLKKLDKEQRFTEPPARYTEATLIRAMEEKGIGRPSTYAPTISTITGREYVAKEGKHLKPTSLGEVVTGLMEERFPDIVDRQIYRAYGRPARRDRKRQDRLEKRSAKISTAILIRRLTDAEKALEGVHIKVPDEVTDEVCDKCGRHHGRKERSVWPLPCLPRLPRSATLQNPSSSKCPAGCPKCGGRIFKRTSKKGYAYYACERGAECGFMTWDVPVKDVCPSCGKTLFKLSGKGARKPFCVNPECDMFVPEEKRGYRRKAAADKTAEKPQESAAESTEKKDTPKEDK